MVNLSVLRDLQVPLSLPIVWFTFTRLACHKIGFLYPEWKRYLWGDGSLPTQSTHPLSIPRSQTRTLAKSDGEKEPRQVENEGQGVEKRMQDGESKGLSGEIKMQDVES